MTCVYIYSTRCHYYSFFYFFFNETATTEIYTYLHTLSLHDALPIWKYIRSTGTSAALAIFQKPVFQRSTRLRVPSGASPYQNLSLPRISAAACSTTPWAALRSTGITPRRLRSTPSTGIRNSEPLPRPRMSTPRHIWAATHRHPGGPGGLPEAGLPALHPLARALRRKPVPAPVAAADQRRGLFDHALGRLAIHRDHAQALEQPADHRDPEQRVLAEHADVDAERHLGGKAPEPVPV